MIQRFDHVTVVVRDLDQARRFFGLLGFADSNIERLEKIGFNHVCFAVDDIEAEVARLRAQGVAARNELMEFHSRKLIFLEGPEGITVELSEWQEG